MKFLANSLIQSIFFRGSQLGGIFLLAMLLGGPNVRREFYAMTSDLTKVSSRSDFAEWMVRSQFRLIDLTKVDWRPISVFPHEAQKFK